MKKKRDRMKGSLNEVVITDRILTIVSLVLFCILIVLMFRYYTARPNAPKGNGASSRQMDLKKAVKTKWDGLSGDDQEDWKDYLSGDEK